MDLQYSLFHKNTPENVLQLHKLQIDHKNLDMDLYIFHFGKPNYLDILH